MPPALYNHGRNVLLQGASSSRRRVNICFLRLSHRARLTRCSGDTPRGIARLFNGMDHVLQNLSLIVLVSHEIMKNLLRCTNLLRICGFKRLDARPCK